MKIKDIKNGNQKYKKIILSTAMMGLSAILASCNPKSTVEKEPEYISVENISEEANKTYSKKDLMVVITNDGEGTPEYHFVTEAIKSIQMINEHFIKKESTYISITDPTIKFPNQEYAHNATDVEGVYYYETVRKGVVLNDCPVYGGWIPDYHVQNYVMQDIDYLPMPFVYKMKSSYSFDELVEIEKTLNSSELNVLPQVEDQKFNKDDLRFVLTSKGGFLFEDGKSIQVMEAQNPNHAESLEYNFYFYSITNPMRGAKIDTNMSAMLFDSQQGAFYDTVDVVSLDKKDEMIEEGCMYFALQDLISFPILQKYQKEQELSYEQVVEIEQALTKNFMDEEVQIIGSKLQ